MESSLHLARWGVAVNAGGAASPKPGCSQWLFHHHEAGRPSAPQLHLPLSPEGLSPSTPGTGSEHTVWALPPQLALRDRWQGLIFGTTATGNLLPAPPLQLCKPAPDQGDFQHCPLIQPSERTTPLGSPTPGLGSLSPRTPHQALQTQAEHGRHWPLGGTRAIPKAPRSTGVWRPVLPGSSPRTGEGGSVQGSSCPVARAFSHPDRNPWFPG